jgi:hypothetical protein
MAIQKHHKTIKSLRDMAFGILGRMFFSENEISEIKYKRKFDNMYSSFRTPLGGKFFEQLKDLELAELLDRFRERPWAFRPKL